MDYFFNSVQVYQGRHCIQNLTTVLESLSLKGKKILVLQWDERVRENEDLQNVMADSKEGAWQFYTFQKSNPETTDLYEVYKNTKNMELGLVIAVGGGSVMDVAKSLCCIHKEELDSEETLAEGIKNKTYQKPACPWIGVPTTSGTGSEVTCWATIWNPKQDSKLSLECKKNYACAAFVDAQFTSSMPLKLAVSSALDAVAHATESFWAKGTNSVSKALALRAIHVIMGHIDGLFDRETEGDAHEYLAQGSVLAGMAFSNTKTTACHSLSYPLTLKYQIPHGVAVTLFLTPVMKINGQTVEEMDELLKAFQAESIEALSLKIKVLMEKAGIPFTLQEWGVKEEDFEFLAEHGGTKGRIDNNPVDLSKDEIIRILKSIY